MKYAVNHKTVGIFTFMTGVNTDVAVELLEKHGGFDEAMIQLIMSHTGCSKNACKAAWNREKNFKAAKKNLMELKSHLKRFK